MVAAVLAIGVVNHSVQLVDNSLKCIEWTKLAQNAGRDLGEKIHLIRGQEIILRRWADVWTHQDAEAGEITISTENFNHAIRSLALILSTVKEFKLKIEKYEEKVEEEKEKEKEKGKEKKEKKKKEKEKKKEKVRTGTGWYGPLRNRLAIKRGPRSQPKLDDGDGGTGFFLHPHIVKLEEDQSARDMVNEVKEMFLQLDAEALSFQQSLDTADAVQWALIIKKQLDDIYRRLEQHTTQLYAILPIERPITSSGAWQSQEDWFQNFTVNASYLPFDYIEHFPGRDSVLKSMADTLCTFDSTSTSSQPLTYRRVVLYGMSGVGKSSIASQFGHRARTSDQYTSIIWIDATNRLTISCTTRQFLERLIGAYATRPHGVQYSEIARRLQLEEDLLNKGGELKDDDTKTDHYLKVLKAWLSMDENDKWLCIIDNLDNRDQYSMIDSILPTSPTGNTIIISKRTDLNINGAKRFEIDVLMPDAAVALLMGAIRNDTTPSILDDEDGRRLALELVEKLGYLPLVISQVGAFILHSGTTTSIGAYLDDFERQYDKMVRQGRQGTGNIDNSPHIAAAWTAWTISYNSLPPNTRRILTTCSFINNSDILDAFFDPAWSDAKYIWEDDFDRTEFELCLDDIFRLSLAKRKQRDIYDMDYSFWIHPLLHSWLKQRVTEGDQEQYATALRTTVQICAVHCIPNDGISDNTSLASRHLERRILPHLGVVSRNLEKVTTSLSLSNHHALYEDGKSSCGCRCVAQIARALDSHGYRQRAYDLINSFAGSSAETIFLENWPLCYSYLKIELFNMSFSEDSPPDLPKIEYFAQTIFPRLQKPTAAQRVFDLDGDTFYGVSTVWLSSFMAALADCRTKLQPDVSRALQLVANLFEEFLYLLIPMLARDTCPTQLQIIAPYQDILTFLLLEGPRRKSNIDSATKENARQYLDLFVWYSQSLLLSTWVTYERAFRGNELQSLKPWAVQLSELYDLNYGLNHSESISARERLRYIENGKTSTDAAFFNSLGFRILDIAEPIRNDLDEAIESAVVEPIQYLQILGSRVFSVMNCASSCGKDVGRDLWDRSERDRKSLFFSTSCASCQEHMKEISYAQRKWIEYWLPKKDYMFASDLYTVPLLHNTGGMCEIVAEAYSLIMPFTEQVRFLDALKADLVRSSVRKSMLDNYFCAAICCESSLQFSTALDYYRSGLLICNEVIKEQLIGKEKPRSELEVLGEQFKSPLSMVLLWELLLGLQRCCHKSNQDDFVLRYLKEGLEQVQAMLQGTARGGYEQALLRIYIHVIAVAMWDSGDVTGEAMDYSLRALGGALEYESWEGIGETYKTTLGDISVACLRHNLRERIAIKLGIDASLCFDFELAPISDLWISFMNNMGSGKETSVSALEGKAYVYYVTGSQPDTRHLQFASDCTDHLLQQYSSNLERTSEILLRQNQLWFQWKQGTIQDEEYLGRVVAQLTEISNDIVIFHVPDASPPDQTLVSQALEKWHDEVNRVDHTQSTLSAGSQFVDYIQLGWKLYKFQAIEDMKLIHSFLKLHASNSWKLMLDFFQVSDDCSEEQLNMRGVYAFVQSETLDRVCEYALALVDINKELELEDLSTMANELFVVVHNCFRKTMNGLPIEQTSVDRLRRRPYFRKFTRQFVIACAFHPEIEFATLIKAGESCLRLEYDQIVEPNTSQFETINQRVTAILSRPSHGPDCKPADALSKWDEMVSTVQAELTNTPITLSHRGVISLFRYVPLDDFGQDYITNIGVRADAEAASLRAYLRLHKGNEEKIAQLELIKERHLDWLKGVRGAMENYVGQKIRQIEATAKEKPEVAEGRKEN